MPRRPTIHHDVDIDLHPYLIRYLTNPEGDQIMCCRPKTQLGDEILKMLSFPQHGYTRPRISRDRKLTIRLPSEYLRMNRLCPHISDRNKIRLATAIELIFWLDLYEFVLERLLKFGENQRTSIMKFREMHGIDEEIFKFDSMERRFRRIKGSEKSQVQRAFA